jgi:hypothetical protein
MGEPCLHMCAHDDAAKLLARLKAAMRISRMISSWSL